MEELRWNAQLHPWKWHINRMACKWLVSNQKNCQKGTKLLRQHLQPSCELRHSLCPKPTNITKLYRRALWKQHIKKYPGRHEDHKHDWGSSEKGEKLFPVSPRKWHYYHIFRPWFTSNSGSPQPPHILHHSDGYLPMRKLPHYMWPRLSYLHLWNLNIFRELYNKAVGF